MDMNENLDLREILKDAPNGLELWSYACGTCYFNGIIKYTDYPIVCKTTGKNGQIRSIEFTKEGKRDTIYSNGKCVLFPSKENRDWSTFKVPEKHKHFEPGQKVLVPYYDGYEYKWKMTIYSHYEEESKEHVTVNGVYMSNERVLPYEGNEDKLGKRIWL